MQARTLCVLAFCLFASASAESEKGAKDALEKALNSVEARIDDTAEKDQNLQTEIQANCTRDLETLDSRIAAKQTAIANMKKQIAATEERIQVLDDKIQALEGELTSNNEQLGEKKQELADGIQQRADEAATYKQYDEDTKVAIEAVIQVQGIVADSKLGAGADETAADYADKTLRNTTTEDHVNAGVEDLRSTAFLSIKTSALLQKLSGRVQDPNVKSFVEMAALSAQAMKKGDVSRLTDLLKQLEEELVQYQKDLKAEEDKAIADWAVEKAAIEGVIASLEAEIKRLEAELARAETQRTNEKNTLAQEQAALALLEKEERDLQAQRDALDKMCKDELAEFNERKARRDEEIGTLNSIRVVIEKELGSMKSHTDGGIGYTAEDGFRWVIGTYDGVPCEDRVQVKPTWCIEVATNARQSDTIKCGPSPKNIRRSCRNETPQNDY